MMKHFLVLSVMVFILSCDKEQKFDEIFNHLNIKKIDLYDQQIVDQSDTLILEKTSLSYIGILSLIDNQFCFTDEKFCRKYNFQMDGKFIDYNFNKGKSKAEIDGENITGYTGTESGNHCIVSSTKYSLYDNSYRKYKSGILNVVKDKSIDATNPMIYTMSYDKFILKSYKNFIYYNMTLQHPEYNFIETPTKFYSQARNLFVYDYVKGENIAMIGRYPELYMNSGHNQFSLINFDVSKKGYIYLSFEADKNIYIYDNMFKPTVCFGVEGIDMDVNYPKLTTYEDFRANYQEHRQKYSFYKDILYVESFNLIARIYSKGIKNKDGLQIYNKDYDLIADLEVPKDSKIVGADLNYLYLYTINEMFEDIKILKIKLKP